MLIMFERNNLKSNIVEKFTMTSHFVSSQRLHNSSAPCDR